MNFTVIISAVRHAGGHQQRQRTVKWRQGGWRRGWGGIQEVRWCLLMFICHWLWNNQANWEKTPLSRFVVGLFYGSESTVCSETTQLQTRWAETRRCTRQQQQHKTTSGAATSTTPPLGHSQDVGSRCSFIDMCVTFLLQAIINWAPQKNQKNLGVIKIKSRRSSAWKHVSTEQTTFINMSIRWTGEAQAPTLFSFSRTSYGWHMTQDMMCWNVHGRASQIISEN